MKSKLDELLDSIDPSKTIDQVSTRANEAINSFDFRPGIIEDWNTFRCIFIDFFRHTENVILRIGSFESPDPDIDWGRCITHLLKTYGKNGEKAAFEMVRTGVEGGIYTVLKRLATQMAKEYAGNEIRAKAWHFWDSLSVDEQLSTMDEYLLKYGHLLPWELTEGSAARIKASFLKVLAEHPKLIKRLRKIGR